MTSPISPGGPAIMKTLSPIKTFRSSDGIKRNDLLEELRPFFSKSIPVYMSASIGRGPVWKTKRPWHVSEAFLIIAISLKIAPWIVL